MFVNETNHSHFDNLRQRSMKRVNIVVCVSSPLSPFGMSPSAKIHHHPSLYKSSNPALHPPTTISRDDKNNPQPPSTFLFVLVKGLTEDCLVLAFVSIVSGEALAESLTVVADSTSRAVTSLGVSVSEEDIRSGGALLEGAVRATEAKIALATDMLKGIPSSGVGGSISVGGSKGGLGKADSAVVAVRGTHGPLAGHTLVSVEALTLSGLAVAGSLVGALHTWVSIVGSDSSCRPGKALGAGTEGAVVLSPGRIAIGAVVAGALVCGGRRRGNISGVRRGQVRLRILLGYFVSRRINIAANIA